MVLRKRLLLALGLLLVLIVISTTGYRVLGGPSITFPAGPLHGGHHSGRSGLRRNR